MAQTRNFQPIENYGVIGNMRAISLVGTNGSIDFLCFPCFDSPTVFAGILDPERGGHFQISPDMKDMRTRQMYLPDTNILLTRFLSEDGVAEITDFMPVVESGDKQRFGHHIMRTVSVTKGSVRFHLHCAPRFDYARCKHTVKAERDVVVFAPERRDCAEMALHATVPLKVDDEDATASFTLKAGETATAVFGEVREERGSTSVLNPENIKRHFDETARF